MKRKKNMSGKYYLDGLALNIQPANQADLLRSVYLFASVWEALPHTVFFLKDKQARYVYANRTLLARLRLADMADLIGKTAEQAFDGEWGGRYTSQDRAVLAEGRCIEGELELHIDASGGWGWCVTHKMPIYDQEGNILAMMGISSDIAGQDANKPELNRKIDRVAQYIRGHFERNINMRELEVLTGLSGSQIERYFKKVFHLTPMQYLQKVRIDHAVILLDEGRQIADVAASCGYADHSAFSRQFKATTGMTPSAFRSGQPHKNEAV